MSRDPSQGAGRGIWAAYGKRGVDIGVAGFALILLSPIIALTALAIAVKLGRPILFRQMRPGLGGTPFRLVKFRSMLDRTDASGRPLGDAVRLTRFGRFLRSTSLDELPELWNVLRGEMSLVGPRPLLVEYLELYSPYQMRRHEVRPGITGWAQVNGRNAVPWADRFAMDVWYVDHVSLALDAKVLILTLFHVLARRGINAEGEATMPYFTGEPDRPVAPGVGPGVTLQANGGRSGIEA